MKAVLWFLTGIVGGLALGHVVANDPRGRALMDELNTGAREFVSAVKEGYSEQSAPTSK